MNYTVKITLTETYEREVKVEAESKEQAMKIARDKWEDNEYTNLFDAPDNSETDFAIVEAPKYKADLYFSPFKRLKVVANVDWDDDDSGEVPDREFEVTFTAQELKDKGVIGDYEDDPTFWIFHTDWFEEWFGEYLTSFTDFLHKGFIYKIQPLTK